MGPASWMWLLSKKTISLPRPRWPASEDASEPMPSWMSPSLAITYVWWSISSVSPELKRAASIRSASAMPTDIASPWPSGPVVASIPGASRYWYSGCPAVGLLSWRKFLRSSSVMP